MLKTVGELVPELWRRRRAALTSSSKFVAAKLAERHSWRRRFAVPSALAGLESGGCFRARRADDH